MLDDCFGAKPEAGDSKGERLLSAEADLDATASGLPQSIHSRPCSDGLRRARGTRCRASFFHRRNDGSPLTLQQHHDEPGRLRVAGVAPHDVNIGWPLVERLPCLERYGSLVFQL